MPPDRLAARRPPKPGVPAEPHSRAGGGRPRKGRTVADSVDQERPLLSERHPGRLRSPDGVRMTLDDQATDGLSGEFLISFSRIPAPVRDRGRIRDESREHSQGVIRLLVHLRQHRSLSLIASCAPAVMFAIVSVLVLTACVAANRSCSTRRTGCRSTSKNLRFDPTVTPLPTRLFAGRSLSPYRVSQATRLIIVRALSISC